jgi:hypothetical protein
MGTDKNSPQRTWPMSQSQLRKSHTNTNRQDNIVMGQLQVLGTIPRRTRTSTRKDAKEPIKLGKFLRTDHTVHLAARGLSGREGRTVLKNRCGLSIVQKSSPTENSASWRTVREEVRRKQRTRKNTSPKSSPDLPNG